MEESFITLDQMVNLAQRLSPLEKLRLIESLAADLEKAVPAPTPRRRSLRGVLKGCAIGEEEIAQARQEMWGNFPREDL